MTTKSDLYVLKGRDLENFGFSRVRDVAYDAVQELWRRRKAEGWNQVKLAGNLDRDTGWLSRRLRGPGNWTLRTFGALVQGLEGEVEIRVRAAEDLVSANFHAYAGYVLDVQSKTNNSARLNIQKSQIASLPAAATTIASSSSKNSANVKQVELVP
jgi:hypothetical protein